MLDIPQYRTEKNLETIRAESLHLQIKELQESASKNKQISAQINSLLESYLIENPHITVIHHYYFNKIKFPGQRARFYFKDIALSEYFLESKEAKFISGHIHQGFIYQNYLCLGSVRSSSSLEYNQLKVLAIYHPETKKISLYQQNINPYLLIEKKDTTESLFEEESRRSRIDKVQLQKHNDAIVEQTALNFQSDNSWESELITQKITDRRSVHVSVQVQDLDYSKIDEYIDPDLRAELSEVRLKKQQEVSELLEEFDIASKNLTSSFADRKSLLKAYLHQKFPDEFEAYQEILREEKIL
ncbi:MAG: hypothetical protein GXP45_05735 [bacterium]|nr:hypothetical protein [bacterium]